MSSSVTSGMVDHYVGLMRDGNRVDPYFGDAMAWMVVRGRHHRLTIADVAERLGADPGKITPCLPVNMEPDPGHVALGQREENVIVWARNGWFPPETLARVSLDAQAWGFYWLVNNANCLFYAADGDIVTELNTLHPTPAECWGRDPRALDDHLGALWSLHKHRQDYADDDEEDDEEDPGVPARHGIPFHSYSHDPDWETGLATVEALTGVRLDIDWLTSEQASAYAPGSLG
ncbi:hypothetical protein [Nonomuraea soli]|uniref:Uncharacterized protein n=1 Tax=Nonomuraea soli TaxID=1032476 RepID=A0A7W0CNH3_9ACTN|nr:hypothetical protein [Nonomuraea soli]MBA2894439.1 hypothetical protein [Nonomuraea soli]